MKDLWIRKNVVKQKKKLKLYNTLVKSILMYNCGTWGLTKNDEDNLDSFHRQQTERSFRNKVSTQDQLQKCLQKSLYL